MGLDRTGAAIGLRAVSRSYGSGGEAVRALDGVSLNVTGGSVVGLRGPSGSGKSTLLQLLGGIDQPDTGDVLIDEVALGGLSRRELAAYRQRVGFVFQRFNLLSALTARENVVAPTLPRKVDFDRRARADALLTTVGLAGREGALPSELSGGQQQRVAIARALINEPSLLLADEPTGSLDSATGTEILEMLIALRERLGTTLVIATHDAAVAARCDRVVSLRDGRVVDDAVFGAPDLAAARRRLGHATGP